MRTLMLSGSPAGYWAGPDAKAPLAAFLAASVPGKGVQSVVSIGRKTIVRFDGKVDAGGLSLQPVSSLDLEGAIVNDWVLLFHTEARMARSALSFDTGSGSDLQRFLVTGLAPGTWEIWRDGWLVDIGLPVEPREAVLYFEGKRGSYFVRRLG